MTSEKRAQKFHTDDVSLPKSGWCFWLVVPRGKFASTNQKHYPDLGSDASSVWNFCACFSDVISRGNQWRRREMFFMIFMFSSEKPIMSKSTGRLTHPIPDRSHFRIPFDGNAWRVSHKRLSQEWRKTSSSRWRTKNRSTKSKTKRSNIYGFRLQTFPTL